MLATISESLLERSTATDGRIVRDRVLSGFGVRLNARKRTFLIATSVSGKQFRMMLGHWPLMTVAEARSHAMDVLRQCRNGDKPSKRLRKPLPTLREAYHGYVKAKGIKASSQKRYDSLLRTHFGPWMDRVVADLGHEEFTEHCHQFAQSNGSAIVEIGRGVVGALIKYINAVHGLNVITPFTKLAAAGLLPERAKVRAPLLQESELPAWKAAVDQLGKRQQDFLYLTLYTGLRRNEPHVGIMQAPASQLDPPAAIAKGATGKAGIELLFVLVLSWETGADCKGHPRAATW